MHVSTPYPTGVQVPSQNNTPRLPPVIPQRKLMVAVRPPTPQTPTRLNDKTARRIVSPKMKTNENNCENKKENVPVVSTPKDKLAGIKSPLREINNQVVGTPNVPQTPSNAGKKPGVKPSTSKKSLIKRFLGSATPAKTHAPRKLTTSTHSNNITMTTFQDPQECIDRIVQTLSTKGVECKQKEYGTPKSKKPSIIPRLRTFVVRKNPTNSSS